MTKAITETVNGWNGSQFSVEIVPGKSITISGFIATGTKQLPLDGKNNRERLYLAAMEGEAEAWLALADCLEEEGYESAAFCRQLCERLALGVQREDDAACIGRHVTTKKQTFRMMQPKTFTIGSEAEYGSYNLIYTGAIKTIGKKTVSVYQHGNSGRTKRMTLVQFASRNYDFDAVKIDKQNSDTMLYI